MASISVIGKKAGRLKEGQNHPHICCPVFGHAGNLSKTKVWRRARSRDVVGLETRKSSGALWRLQHKDVCRPPARGFHQAKQGRMEVRGRTGISLILYAEDPQAQEDGGWSASL
jgi:hypothetical protein